MAGSRPAAAIPSRRVDLPEPFSPTKNVTGLASANASSVLMAGTENGKASSAPPRRLTEARWIALTARTYLLREVLHRTYNTRSSELQPSDVSALRPGRGRYGTCRLRRAKEGTHA